MLKYLYAMKIKIQRTEETITFQEMVPDEETKEVLKKDLEGVNQGPV